MKKYQALFLMGICLVGFQNCAKKSEPTSSEVRENHANATAIEYYRGAYWVPGSNSCRRIDFQAKTIDVSCDARDGAGQAKRPLTDSQLEKLRALMTAIAVSKCAPGEQLIGGWSNLIRFYTTSLSAPDTIVDLGDCRGLSENSLGSGRLLQGNESQVKPLTDYILSL